MEIIEVKEDHQGFFLGMWAETSTLTLLVSEWIWLAAIFALFFNFKQDVVQVFVSFALPGFLGYGLSKALHVYKISKRKLRIVLTIWVITCLGLWFWLFVLNREQIILTSIAPFTFSNLIGSYIIQSLLLQVIFFLLIIRRSLRISTKAINNWQVLRSLQIGLLMLLFFGLSTTWTSFLSNLIPFALYLFFVLLSLTTSHLAELSSDFRGRSPAFSRSWLIILAALAFGFVVVGSLTGWLLGVVLLEPARIALDFLYHVLIVILLVIFTPLLLLLAGVLPFINQLSIDLQLDFIKRQIDALRVMVLPQPEAAEEVFNLLNNSTTIILIIIALVIGIAIISGFRLRKLRKSSGVEEEIVDLARVQKFLRDNQKKRSIFESALTQARRWLATARIRRIYAQLLRTCAELEVPRPSFTTPLEFQPQLDLLFPDLTHETALITQTYLKIRYGEYPESLDEMDAAFDAWEKIRAAANIAMRRRKKSSRKGKAARQIRK